MATAHVRIQTASGEEPILPVIVPNLEDVRGFAADLHVAGVPWSGEAFGWRGEYIPRSSQPPIDSLLAWTPAEFWLGESGVWFFSLVWELNGGTSAVEFLDDSGLVRT